jgi:hypothetical protein
VRTLKEYRYLYRPIVRRLFQQYWREKLQLWADQEWSY